VIFYSTILQILISTVCMFIAQVNDIV